MIRVNDVIWKIYTGLRHELRHNLKLILALPPGHPRAASSMDNIVGAVSLRKWIFGVKSCKYLWNK